ncbi:lipid asymmetry maintenance protein MlaB [Salinivibrio sp. ES.052]|uniref:STAS domain-containing protein n=1 Tax=Salinivibrio sp. ES.052 TaxID=1882823 RepID=UPI000926D537|nr:STAS domain-containing protein [Salinivibrio sp. ES.052]SIO04692.1 STAS domain-containing protein [Salinivibrio sp. ES.052]
MRIELGEWLDITQVQLIKDELASQIASGEVCEVDAAKLSRVDSAGLQLLLSMVIACKEWQWRNVPDCLYAAAQHAGMTSLLKLNT